MGPYDNFFYDKYTCSKASMPAFEQVYIAVWKIALVNGLEYQLDMFYSSPERSIVLIVLIPWNTTG